MCVLVVKNEKYSKALYIKSRIIVLGKFEYRLYQKSQRYAPVLKYIYFHLLTAKSADDKCILQQGDLNNALRNTNIPDDKMTVIRPPIGDPYFQDNEYWLLNKTLYGLRRYPHH